jgi:hypothetical protein
LGNGDDSVGIVNRQGDEGIDMAAASVFNQLLGTRQVLAAKAVRAVVQDEQMPNGLFPAYATTFGTPSLGLARRAARQRRARRNRNRADWSGRLVGSGVAVRDWAYERGQGAGAGDDDEGNDQKDKKQKEKEIHPHQSPPPIALLMIQNPVRTPKTNMTTLKTSKNQKFTSSLTSIPTYLLMRKK